MICKGVREVACDIGKETYNGEGHDECPPTGGRIGTDSLQYTHPVLSSLGIDGTCPVILDLLDDIVDRFTFGLLGLNLRCGVGLL
jgi:hypothetical protein